MARRIGADDFSIEERHGDVVVFPAKGQDAGLPLQADQLKNIGEAEVVKSSFESHTLERRPSTINRNRHQEPGDYGDDDRQAAHNHFREFARREYRSEPPDENGQADRCQKNEESKEADERSPLEELSRSR